jgi:hypothetical protein
MNSEGDIILKYNSSVVPMVNDIIIDDSYLPEEDSIEYIVTKRYFSVSFTEKVILFAEKIDSTDSNELANTLTPEEMSFPEKILESIEKIIPQKS